jgi:uncharacterized protein (TIGR03435 family)
MLVARRQGFSRKLSLLAVGLIVVITPTALGQRKALQQAQSAPRPQVSKTPEWQAAAGDKLKFDVASVRQNKSSDKPRSNVPLTEGTSYYPNGGVFSATDSLLAYILFAYKVKLTETHNGLLRSLPEWVISDRYDIQAKTENHNPTKDQMRVMMQALLEDRFKLAVHREARQVAVFGLVLAKPATTGAQLKPHSADSPCPTEPPAGPSHEGAAVSAPVATLLDVWPIECNEGDEIWSARRVRAGGRNMSMDRIANLLSGAGEAALPIQDQTGLRGNFDFVIEFAPELEPSASINTSNAVSDVSEPTFQMALRDQLGLQLKKQQGLANFFVVDHVKRPSEN